MPLNQTLIRSENSFLQAKDSSFRDNRLRNLENEFTTIYTHSYEAIRKLYYDEFLHDEMSMKLFEELRNNMIEYKYLVKAGIAKEH
mmetsp:Transcript_9525/g.7249  ORF Transcript_9525/g.7249 Transcript_9525/m.7249 type:complete len:86 (-) Transcript_9525:13-270(-)